MFARLRYALTALISLPIHIQQLQIHQHETNSLLRELLVAITTQPAETPRADVPSPVGTALQELTDPQPMPSPPSPKRRRQYTDKDVHLPQSTHQLIASAHRDAQRSSRIVPEG